MAKITSAHVSTTSVGMKLWSLFLFQITVCCFGPSVEKCSVTSSCYHYFLWCYACPPLEKMTMLPEGVVRIFDRNTLDWHVQVFSFFDAELLCT
ncbi:hypothetical protein EUGRSUZ_F00375 [Eucalyptus grandis]|uniref:Uncharacterized protein n=2 Tax=Eucalyptus grandis TaxID=71139 RepID=A0ACC3KC06_EUCGR|nr:hypothetical protein EUGRSUZ_F00375 [Eucalyptus grandis]